MEFSEWLVDEGYVTDTSNIENEVNILYDIYRGR